MVCKQMGTPSSNKALLTLLINWFVDSQNSLQMYFKLISSFKQVIISLVCYFLINKQVLYFSYSCSLLAISKFSILKQLIYKNKWIPQVSLLFLNKQAWPSNQIIQKRYLLPVCQESYWSLMPMFIRHRANTRRFNNNIINYSYTKGNSIN